MENGFKQYIDNYLHDISPLSPLPTDAEERWERIGNIRAVLFDIYGTLVISGTGDIDACEYSPSKTVKSLNEAGISVEEDPDGSAGRAIIELYREEISQRHERAHTQGIAFPEIDVRDVWEQVVRRSRKRGLADFGNEPDYRKVAFSFEMMNNHVYPMPGMKDVITRLSGEDIRLGMISNSQFFSPVIVNYFLTRNVDLSLRITLFDPALCVYSFEERRGKPDVYLYEKAASGLAEYGIRPGEALFVGNDMLNDIYPAQQAGFRTVLFAGDRRSLRMRRDHPELRGLAPDAVITDLSRIPEIAG